MVPCPLAGSLPPGCAYDCENVLYALDKI